MAKSAKQFDDKHKQSATTRIYKRDKLALKILSAHMGATMVDLLSVAVPLLYMMNPEYKQYLPDDYDIPKDDDKPGKR